MLPENEIKENLESISHEIALLMAMYPRGVFFESQDHYELFVDRGDYQPLCLKTGQALNEKPLKFVVQLSFDVDHTEATIDVHFEVNANYPSVELPRVHLRSDYLKRKFLSNLNSGLMEALPDICVLGEVSTCACLEWVQKRREEILDAVVSKAYDRKMTDSEILEGPTLMRYWLVSHHIYRKELIQKIKNLADELDLTGFYLCGKPGVICVEGAEPNCAEYCSRLKRNGGNVWKHINCKHTEFVSDENPRLSDSFKEVSFMPMVPTDCAMISTWTWESLKHISKISAVILTFTKFYSG